MAGSLNHLIDDDGSFTHELIENLGDSKEVCEECFYLLGELTEWRYSRLRTVLDRFYAEERGDVPLTQRKWKM